MNQFSHHIGHILSIFLVKGSISAGKGMLGAGAGASTGVQACATASVFCK